MAELGRNDPCHCGSGKKYKKCHLAADEQRARSGPASQDEVMLQVLSRLKALLMEHEELRPLRFDPEAFERELDAATPSDAALVGMSEEAAELERDKVVRAVLAKLLTPELIRDAAERFSRVRGRTQLDRDALELATLLTKSSLAGKIPPEEDPLGQLLFEVAIEEGGDLFGEVDPAETRQAALEAITSPSPPRLFHFDEWLRMFAFFGHALRKRNTTIEQAGSEAAARAEIAQVVGELDREIDGELRDRIVQRLVKSFAADTSARELMACAMMFENEAGVLASAAITNQNVIDWRSEEEARFRDGIFAVTPLVPAMLQPYAEWLAARGEKDAEKNVRRAQEILDKPMIIMP